MGSEYDFNTFRLEGSSGFPQNMEALSTGTELPLLRQ